VSPGQHGVLFETGKGAQVETTVVSQPRIEKQERRKAQRYNLVLPVIVRNARRQSRNAKSKDVSTRGVYLLVKSDDGLLPGAELDLTLTLPKEVTSGEVLVRAHGTVVRVDKSAGEGTEDMGLAVAFGTCDFTRSTPSSG